MAEHQYIQLPPDSTGKKILHRAEVLLNYDNGVTAFTVGQRVTGETSGVTGDITYKSGTVSSGELHILLTSQSGVDFNDGENLQVDGVTKATANGTGTPIYFPGVSLISGHNTENHAVIDDDGSLYVRFDTGDPALDLAGRQEVVNPVPIAEYNFRYEGSSSNRVSFTTDGTASTTYMPTRDAVRMQVGMSTGDKVYAQSHEYHIFPAGISYGCIFALWVGDTGKSNCRRRWGMFDAEDGYYFEVDSTGINVVWRTSVSGSLVEYRIAQSNWNMDSIDGSEDLNNPSKKNLDVSKTNIYFIESAGSGGTTLGVFIDGKRIRIHSFLFANYFPGTAVQKSNNLPLRAELENTGETASTSELSIISGSVIANTTADALYATRKGLGSLHTGAKTVGQTWEHMFSIRAVQTYQGKDNRAWIFPYLTKFLSVTAPVEYVVSIAPTTELAGVDDGSWTQTGLAEYTIDSTNNSPFNLATYEFGGAGEAITCNHLKEGISPSEAKLIRYADITASPMTVSVYCRSLGVETDVSMSFTWMELY
jgi:hypothetical protein